MPRRPSRWASPALSSAVRPSSLSYLPVLTLTIALLLSAADHGGRQVDGCVASLDMLPEIAAAVKGNIEILFDSGVRTGSDIVKALALGADTVLIGRPYVYGLAMGGKAGVKHVIKCASLRIPSPPPPLSRYSR